MKRAMTNLTLACLAAVCPLSPAFGAGPDGKAGTALRPDQQRVVEQEICTAYGRDWQAQNKRTESTSKKMNSSFHVAIQPGGKAELGKGAKIGDTFTVDSKMVAFTIKGTSTALFDSGGSFVLNKPLAGLTPGTRLTRTNKGEWCAEAPGTWTPKKEEPKAVKGCSPAPSGHTGGARCPTQPSHNAAPPKTPACETRR